MTISRKRRHEAMLEQGMHSGNTDAKFDPPPDPKIARLLGRAKGRKQKKITLASPMKDSRNE